MPRDLFGNVTRPSISIGNRKWYTVPVSLISHALVIATIVIVPILAAPMMPGILGNDNPDYIITVLPPPPVPPLPPTALKPVANPDAAPVVSPDGFTPEKPDFDIADVPASVIGGDENIERVIAPPPPIVEPPKPAPGPVPVGGVIRTPVKRAGSDPVYPPMARAAGIAGIVIIEATIGADGRVVNARVLRGKPLLDQAALDAVRTWEYTPTMLNGVPVPVIMTVTVQFTLSR
jgi:periplasmic protein TonB